MDPKHSVFMAYNIMATFTLETTSMQAKNWQSHGVPGDDLSFHGLPVATPVLDKSRQSDAERSKRHPRAHWSQ